MKFNVSILAANEYLPEEIVREEIPDNYLYNDQGEFVFASAILDSERTVDRLIGFLFAENHDVKEVFRDNNTYVLDLSPLKDSLIDFAYLEKFYPDWLESTGRDNSMNEYGMLIDFIGFANKGKDKKHLLMIVSGRPHRS